MQQTTTHDIGHILFLAACPDRPPAGPAQLHDENVALEQLHDVLRLRPGAEVLSGLCLLRLRGWDQTNLSKDWASNKAS